jgi:hypothetical protein
MDDVSRLGKRTLTVDRKKTELGGKTVEKKYKERKYNQDIISVEPFFPLTWRALQDIHPPENCQDVFIRKLNAILNIHITLDDNILHTLYARYYRLLSSCEASKRRSNGAGNNCSIMVLKNGAHANTHTLARRTSFHPNETPLNDDIAEAHTLAYTQNSFPSSVPSAYYVHVHMLLY